MTRKLLPFFVQPVFPNLACTVKSLGLVFIAHQPLSLTLDQLKQILWGWRPGWRPGGVFKKKPSQVISRPWEPIPPLGSFLAAGQGQVTLYGLSACSASSL